MATPFWKQLPRKPRHCVADKAEAHIQLITETESDDVVIPAELIDVSRNGVQLRVAQALHESQPVMVCIRQPGSDLDFHLPSSIIWQRTDEDDRWLVGCQFQQQLNWEDYGELFLHGILEAD